MHDIARAVSLAVCLAVAAASLLFALSPDAAAQQNAAGITHADFDAIHADFFFAADLDFNMSLTPKEVDAQLRRSPPETQGMINIAAYDADGDGLITYDEFTAGADAEFSRRDANGDGVLTPDEL